MDSQLQFIQKQNQIFGAGSVLGKRFSKKLSNMKKPSTFVKGFFVEIYNLKTHLNRRLRLKPLPIFHPNLMSHFLGTSFDESKEIRAGNVGCGFGDFAVYLSQRTAIGPYTGIDICEHNIEVRTSNPRFRHPSSFSVR